MELVPIIGFEETHMISEDGDVFKVVDDDLIPITSCANKSGYVFITLYNTKKRKTFLLHRLVLGSFCGMKDHQWVVRHLDKDKTNNSLSNLKWDKSPNMPTVKIEVFNSDTQEVNRYDSIKKAADAIGSNPQSVRMASLKISGQLKNNSPYIIRRQ